MKKPTKVAEVFSPVTPRPSGPAKTEKSIPRPTTTAPKTTSTIKTCATNNVLADSALPLKKTYEPMPVIESAFHKTPPPQGARKPRTNAKAASTPAQEPEPQPKKFMTAAGATYLKSLEGSKSTNYDKYVAPSPTFKRPSQEPAFPRSSDSTPKLSPTQTSIST